VPVELSTNFDFDHQLAFTDRAIMRQIGLVAREIIVRRTRSGISSDGSPFTPYSPGYAKRKAKELGKADVDLTVSGRMLNAIAIVEVSENSVTLGFNS
jgi:hypothetical protein